jgi:hypothetical protein
MNQRLRGWKSIAALSATGMLMTTAGCSTIERMTGRGASAAEGSKVTLSGAEEVPATATKASGSGTVAVAADRTVSGSVRTTGFTPTMAHIHLAPRGTNGPIIVPLTRSGEGTWVVPSGAKLSEEQFRAFKAGNLYVNVHSAQYPGGEVRGQIRP